MRWLAQGLKNLDLLGGERESELLAAVGHGVGAVSFGLDPLEQDGANDIVKGHLESGGQACLHPTPRRSAMGSTALIGEVCRMERSWRSSWRPYRRPPGSSLRTHRSPTPSRPVDPPWPGQRSSPS